jgi:hypothetical protein
MTLDLVEDHNLCSLGVEGKLFAEPCSGYMVVLILEFVIRDLTTKTNRHYAGYWKDDCLLSFPRRTI